MNDTRPAPIRRSRFLAVACLVLAAVAACGDDEKKDVTVTPAKVHGNVFSGEENEFQFRVESARAIKGRLVWRVAAGTATVKTGEAAVNAGPGAAANVSVKFAVAAFKEGVVLPTKLTVSVVEDGQNKPAATFEEDLWIFPKDPFADRTEWVKGLKLHLFDPKGDTAKVFDAAKVPFEVVKSPEALADIKEGVVIVGEGVSFKDEKGLGAELQKRAAAGLSVLILAPAAGEVLVPGIGGAPAGLEDLTFRREIVRRLDKRLDPGGWLPDGKVVASSLTIKMGEDTVTGEVTPGPGGWPWVEARVAGKGRWAFCGLAVIAKWDAGPTPRFLFARMLEYLTDTGTEQPKKENDR